MFMLDQVKVLKHKEELFIVDDDMKDDVETARH
jgi:hypothetical protein